MPLHEVHWEITNRCNCQCKHCLSMSGLDGPKELTTEEAMIALRTFKAVGVSKIYFTGGEPFSRKDFLSLLEFTVMLGMRTGVITNATLLKKKELETLKRLKVELGISLDGADEVTNDTIRGRGSYNSTIKVLDWCRKNGVAPTLYITLMAQNINQLSSFANLAKKYRCKGIHFNEITIIGRALGFMDELALSVEQKEHLPELVSRATLSIFGEKFFEIDQCCSVDGTTLYMAANGDIYFCTEIHQRRLDLAIGNIRSFLLKRWLEENNVSNHHSKQKYECCYGVYISEHVVLVRNTPSGCALLQHTPPIETLQQLYDALGNLYQGIERVCRKCNDLDCMGYVWLLEKEAKRLYELDVPLVQVNNGPTFIHSFSTTTNGKPNLSVRYPQCTLLCADNRGCKIYKDRPLTCRFYPLGLETKTDGTIVWAIHLDCLYIRWLEEHGLFSDFQHQVKNIINNLSPGLLREIVETYRAVDAISKFPDGENNYRSLQEVYYVQV